MLSRTPLHAFAVAFLAFAIPCSAYLENTVAVKGSDVYYVHRNLGLLILSKSLQVEKVISLPGGPPEEVDADTVTGNAFVACDGGVAFVPFGADQAQWIPDNLSMGSWMGNPIQIKQGFTDVVVCDTAGYAYFCHSYDSSGLTGMQGYVVRMPTSGGQLQDVSPATTDVLRRAFEELVANLDEKKVFTASYSGIFSMYDAAAGTVLDVKSSGENPYLGDVWDFYLDSRELGIPPRMVNLVGGDFLLSGSSQCNPGWNQGRFHRIHLDDSCEHLRPLFALQGKPLHA